MGLLDVFTSIKDRAEKFLNEKNVVTDILGKVEEKTGIKKKVIALGTSDLLYSSVVMSSQRAHSVQLVDQGCFLDHSALDVVVLHKAFCRPLETWRGFS